MGAIYGSLDRDDDVLAIGINRAVDLIARKMASVRNVGVHPGDKEPISVRKGRFGPYVQHGKTVANLPRGVMMEDVTLEQAVALLAEKGKQLRPRGAAGRRGRSGAAAKAAAPASRDSAPAKRKAAPAKRRAAKPKAKRAAPKAPAKRATAAKAPAAKKKSAARPGKAPAPKRSAR
jgi:DNA topoisomerase-1